MERERYGSSWADLGGVLHIRWRAASFYSGLEPGPSAFSWRWIQMALESSSDLILFVAMAALTWMATRAASRHLVFMLLTACVFHTFVNQMLYSVLHIRGWLLVLARFAFSSAIATGAFLAYSVAGMMEPDLGPMPQAVEDFVIPDESSLLGPCEGVQIEPSSEFVTPLSPTKRFGARIAEDSMVPHESPDMKFARDRLGNLLTSIRQGEAPWLNPMDRKPTVRQSS
ncbi:hypothetical protein COOONC_12478 [Cooperia oncophora]